MNEIASLMEKYHTAIEKKIDEKFSFIGDKISQVDDKVTAVKKIVDSDHDNLILTRERTENAGKELNDCWKFARELELKLEEQDKRIWKITVIISAISVSSGVGAALIGKLF